ncbi:universal stress protein [Haloplanus aerogenes]|uniref:Nucleotide-binding universal stress UspA family protein n=1 Tax=Haloplanus aerogenes TaxID=660522 RepID=A0A3M0DTP9_9EURY|nr:universal stress protein [Haloplanus aerogenes]AZH25637.1 universal stress protein [Haloplanus aerogenes]RMB25361.1 nucleotide-binding universal stress UspA family protein [Haloplanus aerogenes]
MFDKLLFPTDGSDGAAAVFDHVLDVAEAHDATVHVLSVADTTRESVTQFRGQVVDALEQAGVRTVQEAAGRASDRGVPTVTEVMQGEPYRTIVDYANTYDIDLVIMPTHGRRGLDRFLLGSTTERVVRRSDVPVLTIRPDDDVTVRYPYRNVLVPTDGSDPADAALNIGIDVANTASAALHLVSVVNVTSLGVDVRTDIQTAALEENAEGILDAAAGRAREAGIAPAATAVEFGGSVSRTVRTYVTDHDIDLVILGTHGRTGFDRYVLGSVTEQLVRTAPVPVLTVRGAPDSQS